MQTRLTQLAINWLQALLGPRPLLGLAGLPRYIADWRRYRREESRMRMDFIDSWPCLTDRLSHTPFDAHYFYQGAWLGQQVCAAGAEKHVDIGSSVMSIGVLSSFVDTVFVDYRPLKANLKGLTSLAGDILHLPFRPGSLTSLSCLHVVEHVGLGRYGDPVDPDGSRKALAELQRVLAPGGRLYLSVPVGRERVCFNAHRVFAPRTVVAALPELRLTEFSLVDDGGRFLQHFDPAEAESQEYGCGFFRFERP